MDEYALQVWGFSYWSLFLSLTLIGADLLAVRGGRYNLRNRVTISHNDNATVSLELFNCV
jgi:hypothetical protein